MGTKVRCLKCGDVIESKHRHDFVMCSCRSCFVDGGNDYSRMGGNFDDMVVIDEDGNEKPVLEENNES